MTTFVENLCKKIGKLKQLIILKQFQISFILQQISRPSELTPNLRRDNGFAYGLLCLNLSESQFFN